MKKHKQHLLKYLLLASYINNFGWGIYAPLYALYVLDIGGTDFDVSMLWGIYALLAGLLMMLFGRLENSKRYNPSVMLVIGYGLFIAVAVSYLSTNSIEQFYMTQIILAVAMGIMTPAAKITYARAQKRGSEAGEWGLFDGGNYILIAVAAFIGGYLFDFGGFPAIFMVMIAIQTVATFFALRFNMSMRVARR